MVEISLPNLGVYCGQILIVVAVAAIGARLFDVPLPRVRLGYWRAVAVLCLALPLLAVVQPSAPLPAPTATSPGIAAAGATDAANTSAGSSSALSAGAYVAAFLLAGMWVRGAWLAMGFATLRRLRRESVPFTLDGAFDALRREIAPGADIRSCGSTQPAVFGFRLPVILLPDTLSALPDDERLTVVCHELLHVRRHDWLWTIAEEALRTVFWFHPAMRYAIARVQASREDVVDAEVVARTSDRRAYMRALLAFAEAPDPAAAASFVRPSQLAARLRRVTEDIRMSRSRLRLTTSALVTVLVAAMGAAATGLRYDLAAQQPADTIPLDAVQFTAAPLARAIVRMDRPSYPPDAWRAGIGATVSLIIRVDPSGLVAIEREPSWQVTVTSTSPVDAVENFWARQGWSDFVNVVTEAIGRWQYVPADSPVTIPVQVTFTPTRVVGPPGIQTSDGRSLVFVRTSGQPPVRVGGAIRPPAKLANAVPVYPEAARAARVQGVVIVEALIGTDGAVSVARILRSIPLLDQAALDTVYQWRFEPTFLNGEPRDVIMTVTVNFTLQ